MLYQPIVTDAFKDHGAFIFRVKVSKNSPRTYIPVELPDPEKKALSFFRK
jgi:hypothetical protein